MHLPQLLFSCLKSTCFYVGQINLFSFPPDKRIQLYMKSLLCLPSPQDACLPCQEALPIVQQELGKLGSQYAKHREYPTNKCMDHFMQIYSESCCLVRKPRGRQKLLHLLTKEEMTLEKIGSPALRVPSLFPPAALQMGHILDPV